MYSLKLFLDMIYNRSGAVCMGKHLYNTYLGKAFSFNKRKIGPAIICAGRNIRHSNYCTRAIHRWYFNQFLFQSYLILLLSQPRIIICGNLSDPLTNMLILL